MVFKIQYLCLFDFVYTELHDFCSKRRYGINSNDWSAIDNLVWMISCIIKLHSYKQ
ncbi:unnamed protein product [Moritella viscosa]|uniref:Uncharacterized protein n=1 Tax=Moritella viscosa TaxID=80854 RepID=A0ABY1HGM7_9GAMM|nr:unnamed protein product [Moritella viscosa]SGZ11626.1 unnamed protein product [Moritella viscosa]SHO27589.1 unnamed protein product [Moritella viscosa]